jgi:hypothetical protein
MPAWEVIVPVSRRCPTNGCVTVEVNARTVTAAMLPRTGTCNCVPSNGRKPMATPSEPVAAARARVGTKKDRSVVWWIRSITVYRGRGKTGRRGAAANTHTAVAADSTARAMKSVGNLPTQIRLAPSSGPSAYPRPFQDPYFPPAADRPRGGAPDATLPSTVHLAAIFLAAARKRTTPQCHRHRAAYGQDASQTNARTADYLHRVPAIKGADMIGAWLQCRSRSYRCPGGGTTKPGEIGLLNCHRWSKRSVTNGSSRWTGT